MSGFVHDLSLLNVNGLWRPEAHTSAKHQHALSIINQVKFVFILGYVMPSAKTGALLHTSSSDLCGRAAPVKTWRSRTTGRIIPERRHQMIMSRNDHHLPNGPNLWTSWPGKPLVRRADSFCFVVRFSTNFYATPFSSHQLPG